MALRGVLCWGFALLCWGVAVRGSLLGPCFVLHELYMMAVMEMMVVVVMLMVVAAMVVMVVAVVVALMMMTMMMMMMMMMRQTINDNGTSANRVQSHLALVPCEQ